MLKGQAKPSLLDSYNLERQPAGETVITRANEGLRDHVPVWEALGMMDPSLEVRKQQHAELSAPTLEGRKRRERLQAGVKHTAHEFHAVGVEMNQRYVSKAVILTDEDHRPSLPEDPVLQHEITSYPGSRLPHAWLNTKYPGKQISTIDLAGHGNFCLLTGIGGEKWITSAETVGHSLGIKINAYSIGWGRDYEDVYFDWARRREISEDGCLLIRPDRFVAWRSRDMISNPGDELSRVLKEVLGH